MRNPRVILRRCESYKVDLISSIIRESISDLSCRIKGKVFIKPNVVTANRRYIHVGILAHKERMLYHDYRIHEKIVDLLEPGYPDLVVSDAIDITYGVEGAPYAARLGALIIAEHPLAADVVAAHIMGYKPEEIQHLRIASERGYGSLNLEDISLSGDADLEELCARPKGEPRLFQVLSELETPIEFYSGHAPDTDIICDGGCECAVKGCLGTIEKYVPGSLKNAKKGAVVTGIYKNDVIMPDGPVLLVGDCTKVEGRLEAKSRHHIKGCPANTRQVFGKVPRLFGMPNPMHDIRGTALFIISSIEKGLNILRTFFLEKFIKD